MELLQIILKQMCISSLYALSRQNIISNEVVQQLVKKLA